MKSPGLFVPICIINAQGWREKTKARLWAEERWLMQKPVSSCHESLKLSPLKGRRPETFGAWAAQVRLKLSGVLRKTLWSSLAGINVLTFTSCKEKGKKFEKCISKTQTQYRHGCGGEGHSPAPSLWTLRTKAAALEFIGPLNDTDSEEFTLPAQRPCEAPPLMRHCEVIKGCGFGTFLLLSAYIRP